MTQSDRNLVFHSGAKAYPPRQLLKTRIEQFIAYFNATMARPFRWTYTGKPLAGTVAHEPKK
jgi:hypothetical protein